MGKIFNSFFLTALLCFQLVPVGIVVFNAYHLSKWDNSPGWVVDRDSNCRFYTNKNFQNRHIRWEGECIDGLAQGKGKLTLYEGNQALYQFDGTLNEGRTEGSGRLRFLSDGDVYEGQFSNGKIHGYGHFYNDDGDHFEGYFLNGIKTGFGTFWYEPDHPLFKYVGSWKNDKMDGEGILYYRNGKVLEGMFKDGEYLSNHELVEDTNNKLPKNILITNDDGVEDMDRLICLAEEMSTFADLVVIAVSVENKSGTSNSMAFPAQGFLETKCLSIDTLRQIYIFEVQGYPADCVMLGALGIFHEEGKAIDLVLSGINGGSNHGAQWFGSGTIGAARTAALGQIPAIAISGINEESDNSENLQMICNWVSDLVQSGIVDQIKPHDYLTVSIPEDLKKIKGSKIIKRAITFDNAPFYLSRSEKSKPKAGEKITWKLMPNDPSKAYNMADQHDVAYYFQDYIVIVPMSVDENNYISFPVYQKFESKLPQLIPE